MVIEQAREVLKIEAQGIIDLIERIGPEFEKAVQMILEAKGRVILTGMGKSGLVGRKISATLNSTGTPSLFLHPAEAIHGDLGMVTKDDIILAISTSGQTAEINNIVPIIKNMGTKIIAFTGRIDSPMALESDVVIDVGVEREACPMGLVPTASTTAALAMGDALAVALINSRRFDKKDFKRFHPGGSLGERLAIKVKEVMLTDDHLPISVLGSQVEQALKEIESKGIGATVVVDSDNRLAGMITDGDLRRALTREGNIQQEKVEKVMSISPKTIDEDQSAAEALGVMELYGITHLIILDREKRVKGLVHLHDLLGREEFKLNGGLPRSTRAHNRPDNTTE
ncbi:MAG: KpsF/GutQ family sugar-phosphate isomerase [Desulfobacteraceae bacterium]|nr:KpsF/GutQ family sugar-phosphate isomerase [Desulfobacteraceae bacterium]